MRTCNRVVGFALSAVGLTLSALGCSAAEQPLEPETVGQVSLGVGEQVNGYPSYQERVELVAINRVRSDPNNDAAGTASSCSTPKDPVPPVMYDLDLAQAARFHCVHSLVNQGGLTHKSYCELKDDLETSGCNGDAACSCVAGTECWSCDTLGGCGTAPAGRASIFGFPGASIQEVGAAGADAWGSVRMWTGECPPQEGHRNTLTASGVNVVGTGYHQGSGCWSVYAFSDFGKIDGMAIARIPSGVHVGNTFYANYYDPAGDPQAIHVVVDGTCHAMEIEIGAAAGNRTYQNVTANPGQGCHEYYFVATDAAGQEARYPETGSLTVGDCADEYVSGQADSSCAQGVDAGAGGTGGGTSGSGGSAGTGASGSGGADVGGSAGTGASGSGGADVGGSAGAGVGGSGASSGTAGGSAADGTWDSEEPSGCACAQGPRGGSGSPPMWLFAGMMLGVMTRFGRRFVRR